MIDYITACAAVGAMVLIYYTGIALAAVLSMLIALAAPVFLFIDRKIKYFRKVAEYADVLKEDNDYGYNSVLRLQAYKLSRLRKQIEKSPIMSHKHTSKVRGIMKKRARRIKISEILCRRLSEGQYRQAMWNKFYKEYPTTNLKKMTPEQQAERSKALRATLFNTKQQEERDLEYLCQLLKKHLTSWRD